MTAPVIAIVVAVVCALIVIVMILGPHRQGDWKHAWSRYFGALRDRSAFSSVRAEAAAIAEPATHDGDLRVSDLWDLSDEESSQRV